MPRVWKFGDSVNTDDILPGKFAPFMAGEDVFQTFAFHYVRPEFAAQVQPGDVLIGGRNWGLGSSREYAPQALKKLRVGGIIAPSFARIHYRNLLNLGIPAFEADLTTALQDGDEVTLDVDAGVLTRGAETFQLTPPPAFLREALREGSILAYYRKYQRFPGEAAPDEERGDGVKP
ncbi:3-isopropylmalate dehydratase small subunit [Deinococcus maricopensis]|uniref:3-isopropylmalate dehydratase, small subunit n=1 Tax=Deinococcus maricopensis (strain DSM 21211 / LMG 22137 / NRRL B-23946 / LB-34) TaxID=709986 RepID=E8U7G4_DEIML|nr:3-isopropylmalate dehydratase small subunit [Deinococcus maricopensis]ADV67003.1 3-isopropylmalate dehydratase, small subunit [Deinococcus maricopensis DSM 21211]